MFERFTDRARRVITLAGCAAEDLGHPTIGTGVPAFTPRAIGLVEVEGVAAQVLVNLGADPSRVRRRVISILTGYYDADADPSAGAVKWPGLGGLDEPQSESTFVVRTDSGETGVLADNFYLDGQLVVFTQG